MKYRFITIVHNLVLPQKEMTVNLAQGFLSNCSSILQETFDNELSTYTLGSHSIDEFVGHTYFYIDGYFADGTTQSVVDEFGTKLTFLPEFSKLFLVFLQFSSLNRCLWLFFCKHNNGVNVL